MNVLNLAVLAAGGYLAYLWAVSQGWFATGTAATSTTPASGNEAAINAAAQNVLLKLMQDDLTRRRQGGMVDIPAMMNYDNWNWHYTQIRGVLGPDLTDVIPQRDKLLTLEEYVGYLAAKGVSGGV